MFAESNANGYIIKYKYVIAIFMVIDRVFSARIMGYLSPVGYDTCVIICSLARMGKGSLSYFYLFIFSFIMPTNNENVSMPNNSTHTSTPNCESVETLLGLSRKQIKIIFNDFFEHPRMCSLALMEMLECTQRDVDNYIDVSLLVFLTKPISVLAHLERMRFDYFKFMDAFDFSETQTESPDWLFNMPDVDPKLKLAVNLHHNFNLIIDGIHDIGFNEFSKNIIHAISYIQTKEAYQDIVLALICVQSLYLAFSKSQYILQPGNKHYTKYVSLVNKI